MSLSTRAYRRSGTVGRGVSSRRAPIQSFLFGAGLALVGLAGGWTGYVHLTGTTAGAISLNDRLSALDYETTASLRADLDALAVADFTERFGFAEPSKVARSSVASSTAPKKKNVYVALLDPTYSLGYSPGSFATRAPAAAIMAKAETPKAEALKAEDALLTRTPVQLALSVPAPQTRPSELRLPQAKGGYGHDALVQRARAALANAKPSNASIFDKLFGNVQPVKTVLAYAGSDGGVLSDGSDSGVVKPGLYDNATAVYDISKRTVYLPDGTKLEAHSGLGEHMDKPDFAHLRMRGVTPPHIYDLKPREALFHGVAALRMTPVGGESAIYGRNGLLTHTYMLGPSGQSNGCVSFKDYNAFLRAYRNGDVKRLIVVASMD